jgi:hypothetical protein
MVVVAGQLVYDVVDPIHPRLICRGTNTSIQLLDAGSIAYIATGGRHGGYVIRHDLTTGAETRIGQLPSDPRSAFAGWTPDGSLEVYATSGVQPINGRISGQIHLWSNGADHVLYGFDQLQTGFESRWNAPYGLADFNPDHRYLAISYPVDFSSSNVRIYSVADRRQLLATGSGFSLGGTWIANDRFVWAQGRAIMQWTPATGATLLRSEAWVKPTSSAGGQWLAATLATNTAKPRVVIKSVVDGRTFITGPGSSPGFVTAAVVWYAEEASCPPNDQCGADPTGPDRSVHAFNVANASDQLVRFRVGEEPIRNGYNFCCDLGR